LVIFNTLAESQNSKNIRHSDANTNVSGHAWATLPTLTGNARNELKIMIRNILIISLTILMFASCNSDNTIEKRKNEITKVCFATGGCYGTCPFLAIEIDSSLNYKFYGGEYADTTGYFTGKVSQGFWDTLNIKFESINYKQLDTSYEHSIDDLSTETVLYFDKQRKHIHGQSASFQTAL
jgi:hypothetical protein